MSYDIATAEKTAKPNPFNAPKPTLYGLPCANCHAYYAADLNECPICNCRERVCPGIAAASIHAAF